MSGFLEEPGAIVPLPSGIIFENTIFSKLIHSMQALKTKLFLLESSLTFGILLRIHLSPSNLESISYILIQDI